MRKIVVFIIICLSFVISSCAAHGDNGNADYAGEAVVFGDKWDENNQTALTCVAVSDVQYYNQWYDLVHSYNGIFNYYNELYPLYTNNIVSIKFTKPIYAEVTLLDYTGNEVYTVIPDANGECYLFPKWDARKYHFNVKYHSNVSNQIVVEQYEVENLIVLDIDAADYKKENIDIMFVVDTTASMDDELNFLKMEIAKVVETISTNNHCNIRVSILLYKDNNEIYKTMYSDFTNNIDEQIEFLSNKIAYGGGDYEEAVSDAMELAASQNWGSENSTNILVHFADAPSHDEDIEKWYNSTLKLNEKGVRMISVASSGINKKTEYLMRSMTLLTNGTYVYLTNDSRIGDEHMDATVNFPFTVEYLDECLIRLIDGYHTGEFSEPIGINRN